MKKDGKYRFSLQFGVNTEEEVMVGEFLERLGNKKSDFLVPVIAEYLIAHPELQDSKVKIEVHHNTEVSIDKIKELVCVVVDEKLNAMKNETITYDKEQQSVMIQDDVVKMLENLELFI